MRKNKWALDELKGKASHISYRVKRGYRVKLFLLFLTAYLLILLTI